MRSLTLITVFLGLVLVTGNSEACPDESGCVMESETQPVVVLPTDEADHRARVLAKDEPATPVIWQQFRSYAYAKLPQHREKNFNAVWIGMAVKTTDETVAGVGLKGVWW